METDRTEDDPDSPQNPGPVCANRPVDAGLDGRGVAVVANLEERGDEARFLADSLNGTLYLGSLKQQLPRLMLAGIGIVVWAPPSVICRIVTPWLQGKRVDPPVVSILADDGVVLPLFGLSCGGSDLAHAAAHVLSSWRSDGSGRSWRVMGTALSGPIDVLRTPPAGWDVVLPDRTAVLARASRGLIPDLVLDPNDPWGDHLKNRHLRFGSFRLQDSGQEVGKTLESTDDAPDPMGDDGGKISMTLAPSEHRNPDARQELSAANIAVPHLLAIGVGAVRDAPCEASVELVQHILMANCLTTRAVGVIATIDAKADEPTLWRLCQAVGGPSIRLFDAKQLNEVTQSRDLWRSHEVYRAVGAYNVAEAAALGACGEGAELIVGKCSSRFVTAAVAMSRQPITAESLARSGARKIGRLAVVGIGPGDWEQRTVAVSRALKDAEVVFGYEGYTRLVRDAVSTADLRSYPIGSEHQRAQDALNVAAEGFRVVLLGSGDAAIYGLAGLVEEIRSTTSDRLCAAVPVVVLGGITAAQVASAAVGAMIGHDFAVISLSDLLTPSQIILQRVEAAAQQGMVQAWYNPRSGVRTALLSECRRVCLTILGEQTPVVIGRCLGRKGERVDVCTLSTLDETRIDMHTVLLVGGRGTRSWMSAQGMRVVTPRGYFNDSSLSGI